MFKRTARMQAWLDWYAGDHRNPVNHAIHIFCIPMILLSAIGMLDFAPLHLTLFHVQLGLGELALALLIAFYAQHDLRLALLAAPLGAVLAVGARFLPWWGEVAVFAVAWIAQILGHSVFEKNKPSLTDNAAAFAVAPAFLLDGLLPHKTTPVAR